MKNFKLLLLFVRLSYTSFGTIGEYLLQRERTGEIVKKYNQYTFSVMKVEKKRTVNTNLRRGELMGENAIATATLDRLLHHSLIYVLKGESYRLKNRMKLGLAPSL
jgi:hypothetical protein